MRYTVSKGYPDEERRTKQILAWFEEDFPYPDGGTPNVSILLEAFNDTAFDAHSQGDEELVDYLCIQLQFCMGMVKGLDKTELDELRKKAVEKTAELASQKQKEIAQMVAKAYCQSEDFTYAVYLFKNGQQAKALKSMEDLADENYYYGLLQRAENPCFQEEFF